VPQPYEWAVLRVVPRVERCEFVNVGALVYSHQTGYLGARVELVEQRALALDPFLDLDLVRRHLGAVVALCAGEPSGGQNANRPAGERFRWLVAPRSTVVQTSRVHTGLTDDPAAELDRLVSSVVLVPDRPDAADERY
jgi:Protein of unknown function (DUF3037)